TSMPALNALLAGVDFCLVLGGQLSHVATAGYHMALPDTRMVWVRPAAAAGEGHFPKARKISGEPRGLLDGWRRDGAAASSRWTDEEMRMWRTRLKQERQMGLPEPKVHGVDGESAEGLFEAVRKALPRESIVVTDSGLHQV